MGKNIELSAAYDHKFSVYVAEPSGKPKGALIVVMETRSKVPSAKGRCA